MGVGVGGRLSEYSRYMSGLLRISCYIPEPVLRARKQTGQASSVSVDVISYGRKGTISVVRDRG